MEKRGAASPDSMNEMFRAVHSIKGAAGFLGLEAIQQLSHAMESLFMALRDGDLAFRAPMGDPLLEGVDALRGMLRSLRDDVEEQAEVPTTLVATLLALVSEEAASDDPDPELTDACRRQVDRGHHVVVVPLPSRKADRAAFLARVERYGELVRERAPGRTQAVVASPLEPDLLAEALALQPDEVRAFERTPLASAAPGDAEGSRAFDVLAVELGFLDEAERERILALGGETGRSFGATAVERGVLTHEQCALIRAEQLIRFADRAGEGKRAGASPAAEGPDRRAETVRVQKALLDKLMDLAGELVLGRNQLRQVLSRIDERPVRALFQNVDRVTSQLQEHVMLARMQPIRSLYDRLPRLVRDLCRKLGKQVDLELHGAEVELDRTIIEALADPLMHLIRNSLDHGIEAADGAPAARQAGARLHPRLGVPRAGPRGDRDRRRRARDRPRARARGGAPARLDLRGARRGARRHRGARPGLPPGALDGRRGHRPLGSRRRARRGQEQHRAPRRAGPPRDRGGEGSRFVIHLPLTLAILPSLIVSVAGERFAIPQVSLVEVVGLDDDHSPIEVIRGAEVMRVRGNLIPLVRLRACLGLDADARSEADVVVLRSGPHQYGLVVDELHDGEEIVVKPLPGYLADCGWYAGTTILGDGTVVMILDAAGSRVASRCASKTAREHGAARADRTGRADARTRGVLERH